MCDSDDKYAVDMGTIVIVGRQNVGKSTLYNRLLKRRSAIAAHDPGITRDVLRAQWHHCGNSYQLCDTGGQTIAGDGMDREVTAIAQREIVSSALILFVLDIHRLTAEDLAISVFLMPHRERVICVLNKADDARAELLTGDFFRLGFTPLIAVSAEHNRNIDVLSGAIGARSSALGNDRERGEARVAESTDTERYRVAIIGKPNSGKSTLINALTQTPASLVNEEPGTTRDVVQSHLRFTNGGVIHHVEILDTAGMRRMRKVTEHIEFYAVTRTMRAIKSADIVLLLVDAREGVTDGDKKIATHATAHGKGIIFVYNKIDLIEYSTETGAQICDEFRYRFPHLAFAPCVCISALRQQGFSTLEENIAQIWDVGGRRISTSRVNNVARQWMDALIQHKEIKFMYATQVSTHPLKFVFFFKRMHKFPSHLHSYLSNCLRKHFDFHGVPILIELKNE